MGIPHSSVLVPLLSPGRDNVSDSPRSVTLASHVSTRGTFHRTLCCTIGRRCTRHGLALASSVCESLMMWCA